MLSTLRGHTIRREVREFERSQALRYSLAPLSQTVSEPWHANLSPPMTIADPGEASLTHIADLATQHSLENGKFKTECLGDHLLGTQAITDEHNLAICKQLYAGYTQGFPDQTTSYGETLTHLCEHVKLSPDSFIITNDFVTVDLATGKYISVFSDETFKQGPEPSGISSTSRCLYVPSADMGQIITQRTQAKGSKLQVSIAKLNKESELTTAKLGLLEQLIKYYGCQLPPVEQDEKVVILSNLEFACKALSVMNARIMYAKSKGFAGPKAEKFDPVFKLKMKNLLNIREMDVNNANTAFKSFTTSVRQQYKIKELTLQILGEKEASMKWPFATEFRHEKAPTTEEITFFSKVMNQHPWNKTGSHLDEVAPGQGFYVNNARIVQELLTCAGGRETGRSDYGRKSFIRWVSNRLCIFCIIDFRPKLQESVVRWFTLHGTEENTEGISEFRIVQTGYTTVAELQARLVRWSEMIVLNGILQPGTMVHLYVNLMALNPTLFSYDLAECMSLMVSSERQFAAKDGTQQSSLLNQLSTLLKEKASNGGPTCGRDVLLTNLAQLCTVYSTPACQHMNKAIDGTVRNERQEYLTVNQKPCKWQRAVKAGKLKLNTIERQKLRKWVDTAFPRLLDRAKIQAAMKKHDVDTTNSFTMNAIMSVLNGKATSGTCKAEVLEKLLFLDSLAAFKIDSLKNGLQNAHNAVRSMSMLFYIAIKNQSSGHRPIAIGNVAYRLGMAALFDIANMIGEGQDSDCVTQPLLKKDRLKKAAAFFQSAISKNRLACHLFLDITAFCATMPYELCSELFIAALRYAVGSNHMGVATEEERAVADILYAYTRRLMLVTKKDIERSLYADIYDEMDIYRPDHAGQVYKWIHENIDAYMYLFHPVIRVMVKKTKDDPWMELSDKYTFDDDHENVTFEMTYRWVDKPTTYHPRTLESYQGSRAPDQYWVPFRFGSEEGQMMPVESLAFSWILKYILEAKMGFNPNDYLLTVTSDDVLITLKGPERPKGIELTDAQVVMYWNTQLQILKQALSLFHIKTSDHKCCLVSGNGKDLETTAIQFNSNQFSPYTGRYCHHLMRLLRPLTKPPSTANYQDAFAYYRSALMGFMKDEPYMPNRVFRLIAKSMKQAAATSWGTVMYQAQFDKVWTRESPMYDGCPLYTDIRELNQDSLLFAIEKDPRIIKLCVGSADGGLRIDQPRDTNSKIQKRFANLRRNAISSLSQASMQLYVQVLSYAIKHESIEARAAPFSFQLWPKRFGLSIKGRNVNDPELLKQRVTGVLAKPWYLIVKGVLKPCATSCYYVPYYGGDVLPPSDTKPERIMSSFCSLCVDIATVSTDKIIDTITNLVGVGETTVTISNLFIKRNPLIPCLDCSSSTDYEAFTMTSLMDRGLVPMSVLLNHRVYGTIVYNQTLDGSFLYGRQGTLMAKYAPNEGFKELTDEDLLAHRMFFNKVCTTIGGRNSLNSYNMLGFYEDKFHFRLSKLDSDGNIARAHVVTSPPALDAFGSFIYSRDDITGESIPPPSVVFTVKSMYKAEGKYHPSKRVQKPGFLSEPVLKLWELAEQKGAVFQLLQGCAEEIGDLQPKDIAERINQILFDESNGFSVVLKSTEFTVACVMPNSDDLMQIFMPIMHLEMDKPTPAPPASMAKPLTKLRMRMKKQHMKDPADKAKGSKGPYIEACLELFADPDKALCNPQFTIRLGKSEGPEVTSEQLEEACHSTEQTAKQSAKSELPVTEEPQECQKHEPPNPLEVQHVQPQNQHELRLPLPVTAPADPELLMQNWHDSNRGLDRLILDPSAKATDPTYFNTGIICGPITVMRLIDLARDDLPRKKLKDELKAVLNKQTSVNEYLKTHGMSLLGVDQDDYGFDLNQMIENLAMPMNMFPNYYKCLTNDPIIDSVDAQPVLVHFPNYVPSSMPVRRYGSMYQIPDFIVIHHLDGAGHFSLLQTRVLETGLTFTWYTDDLSYPVSPKIILDNETVACLFTSQRWYAYNDLAAILLC